MNKFTVKINLSNFFNDERKLAIILVDPEWKNVEIVQTRVEKLFDLNQIRFVTKDGYFVPPQEAIEILSTVDNLKAFSFEDRKTNEEQSLQCTVQSVKEPSKQKKRKFLSLESNVCNPSLNKPKRSRYIKNISPEITSTNGVELEEQLKDAKTQQKKTNASWSSGAKELVVESFPEECTDISHNTVEKNKRVITKSFHYKENDSHCLILNDESKKRKLSHNKSINKENNSKTSNVRIVFSDDSEDSGDSNENCSDDILRESKASTPRMSNMVFRCALMDITLANPRTFQFNRKQNEIKIIENIRLPERNIAQTLKLITNSTLNIESALEQSDPQMLNSNKDSTLSKEARLSTFEENTIIEDVSDDSSVVMLDDTEQLDEKSVFEDNLFHIGDLLQQAEPLTNLPNIGDTILFKLNHKSSKGVEKQTDYISGSCVYINCRTKIIKVALLTFLPEVETILNKFAKNLDDSTSKITHLDIKLSEMIEPMVLRA